MRCSVRGLLIVTVSVAVAVSTCAIVAFPYWNAAKAVRQIEVERALFMPRTLNPYRPLAIRSEKELRKVIDGLETGLGPRLENEVAEYWLKRCQKFENSLRASNVDFNHESLILIPHKLGSACSEFGLSWPYLQSKKLVCRVWRGRSGDTCNIEYDCFALVIKNDQVNHVEIWIDGVQQEMLSLEAKEGM